MSHPVVGEGSVPLDVILRSYAQKLADTWPGDEALVGMLLQQLADREETTAIAWAPRERVLGDLAGRRDREQDAGRRARFEAAIAAVERPRAAGRILLIVSGWGDLRATELDADDQRARRRLTTGHVGSA